MRIRTAIAATVLAAAGILGATGSAVADVTAEGLAYGSPGVLSGNVIQVPLHAPISACGNSIGLIGLVGGTAGNTCVNT
ncbi:chaplin [Streptomyces sp. NPDC031705]|uniref:chaplin n=1 Tax=unclassified Streptomyces TaxID=2593676 RepID=UPI0033E6A992